MKILLVTGTLAEPSLKDSLSTIKHQIDVITLPVSVAAFITPKLAAEYLKKETLKDYDMLLLPGTVRGDITIVEEVTGIPSFKGPLHASELPLVLESDIQLSKTLPATELIREALQRQSVDEISNVENNWREIINKSGGIIIGRGSHTVAVSDGLPMRVLAEIVNAPLLSSEMIKKKTEYYNDNGASIIDIGMLAGQPMPEKIPEIIYDIRGVTDLPISIDSLDPLEIKSAVDAGVDMVLSLDAGNLVEASRFIGDATAVILPTNMKQGILPEKAEERVEFQRKNIDKAKSLGIDKVVGDLVVEPLLKPGLVEALKAYQMYHEQHPDTPLLFGVGNAVELLDADTLGVHASLIALAREVGAQLLHVPEHSDKAQGSVREAVTASHMMFLAQRRGTLPKDLGIDLLRLKEKRRKEPIYDSSIEQGVDVIHTKSIGGYQPDKSGWFRVQIDRDTQQIVVIHYMLGRNDPNKIFKGSKGSSLYRSIIDEGLISDMAHAAYIGREVTKAEIALKLGRSYVQDESLFAS
jgi:dihydropteroate synthase-like protein